MRSARRASRGSTSCTSTTNDHLPRRLSLDLAWRLKGRLLSVYYIRCWQTLDPKGDLDCVPRLHARLPSKCQRAPRGGDAPAIGPGRCACCWPSHWRRPGSRPRPPSPACPSGVWSPSKVRSGSSAVAQRRSGSSSTPSSAPATSSRCRHAAVRRCCWRTRRRSASTRTPPSACRRRPRTARPDCASRAGRSTPSRGRRAASASRRPSSTRTSRGPSSRSPSPTRAACSQSSKGCSGSTTRPRRAHRSAWKAAKWRRLPALRWCARSFATISSCVRATPCSGRCTTRP